VNDAVHVDLHHEPVPVGIAGGGIEGAADEVLIHGDAEHPGVEEGVVEAAVELDGAGDEGGVLGEVTDVGASEGRAHLTRECLTAGVVEVAEHDRGTSVA
jgi:hypothetical protein